MNCTAPNRRDIPVLIVAYNRPQLLDNLLESLKTLGVRRVYISIDGAKLGDLQDEKLVEKSRNIAIQSVGFHFKKLNISRVHLGCYRGVTSAIDWFFKGEEFGIILEDDLLVAKSFLDFVDFYCSVGQFDSSIGSISGYKNRNPELILQQETDLLSKYPSSWGWATWRAKWAKFRHRFSVYEKVKLSLYFFLEFGPRGVSFFFSKLQSLESGSLDSWAYRWLFTHKLENWYSIVPCENLVLNLGIGPDATHTKGRPIRNTLGKWNNGVENRSRLKHSTFYDALLETKVYGLRKDLN